MSTVQVRDYHPQDFAALHALDLECFSPGIAYGEDELRQFLSARDAVVRIARLQDANTGDTIVGFLIAQIYRGRPTFQARIITIDVAPSHQRRGVGRLLMDVCEEELKSRSVARVRLEVSVTNISAQAFYRKYKYDVVGRIPAYYPTGEDALVLQKQL
jgi:[ribosomal protein S18]-alanine N-acetyltransferase